MAEGLETRRLAGEPTPLRVRFSLAVAHAGSPVGGLAEGHFESRVGAAHAGDNYVCLHSRSAAESLETVIAVVNGQRKSGEGGETRRGEGLRSPTESDADVPRL